MSMKSSGGKCYVELLSAKTVPPATGISQQAQSAITLPSQAVPRKAGLCTVARCPVYALARHHTLTHQDRVLRRPMTPMTHI